MSRRVTGAMHRTSVHERDHTASMSAWPLDDGVSVLAVTRFCHSKVRRTARVTQPFEWDTEMACGVEAPLAAKTYARAVVLARANTKVSFTSVDGLAHPCAGHLLTEDAMENDLLRPRRLSQKCLRRSVGQEWILRHMAPESPSERGSRSG
jgi:hypothetical protein